MLKLHDRLRRARERKGYTQTHVAKMLKVNNKSVSTWETGRAQPNVEIIKQLADLYDVTTEYLVTGRPANASEQDERDLDNILRESSALMFSGVPMSEEDKETVRRLIRGYFWESLERKQNNDK